MTQKVSTPTQGSIDISGLMNESSNIHTNLSQDVVITTEDKLKLCLLEHQDTLKMKSDWKTPVAILATLVPVFLTADFKKTFGIPSDTWTAVFIISCIITFFWSLLTIHQAYKVRNSGDIKNIISEIKKSSNS